MENGSNGPEVPSRERGGTEMSEKPSVDPQQPAIIHFVV